MPLCSDHIEQAEHNKSFAEQLIETKPMLYKDWAVIGAFYSAVHFIEAYRANKNGDHSDGHLNRNLFVIQEFPKKISKAYMKLSRLSRILRYLELAGKIYPSKGTWINDADVMAFVTISLINVEEEVKTQLNPTA